MAERPDVTAILVAHAEGTLAAISLRSLLEAVRVAREGGLEVEPLLILDDPDRATSETLAGAADLGVRTVEVSYADQGLVRNDAVDAASGRYIAFLDGDDLWSENWLLDAHAVCETDPGRVIAHPAVNWAFGEQRLLSFPPDQTDPHFDPRSLRVTNMWDGLCLTPAEAHRDLPYRRRALAEGYAFEDWMWNIETVAAGYLHRVVPETIVFKRSRAGSQFKYASANRSLPHPHPFHEYAWLREWPNGSGPETP